MSAVNDRCPKCLVYPVSICVTCGDSRDCYLCVDLGKNRRHATDSFFGPEERSWWMLGNKVTFGFLCYEML